jgi:hypothetical protein
MSGYYVYLASPYSHPDPAVKQARYEAACRAAARFMEHSEVVFSPIAHSHAIEIVGQPIDPTHDFWMRQDRPLLKGAAELYVLDIDGWKQSKGVTEEIAIAHKLGMPVYLVSEQGKVLRAIWEGES